MSLRELSQRVIDLAAESSSDEDELLPLNTFTSPRKREESGSDKTKNAIRREKDNSSSVVNVGDSHLTERKADHNDKGHNPSPQTKEDREIDEPRMDRNSRGAQKVAHSAGKKAENEFVISLIQSSSEDEDNDSTKNHEIQNNMNKEREWGASYSSSSSIEFCSPPCSEEDASIDDSAVTITQSQHPETASTYPPLPGQSPDAAESDATIDLEKEYRTDRGKAVADGSGATEYDTPVATKTRGRKRGSSSVDKTELLRKAKARTKGFIFSDKEESMECYGGGKEVPAKEDEIDLETNSLRATCQQGSISENCVSRHRKSARVNSIEVVWTAEKKEAYKRNNPCLKKGRPMKRGHVSRFCTACECCSSCIIPPWCPQWQHHSSPVEGDNGLNDKRGFRSTKLHRQRQVTQDTSKKRKRTASRTVVNKTRLAPVEIETTISSKKKAPGPGENLSDRDTELPSKEKSPGQRQTFNDFDTERPVSKIVCRDIPFQPQQGMPTGADTASIFQSTPLPNNGRSTAPLTIEKGPEGISRGTHLDSLFKADQANNETLDVRAVGIEQPAVPGQSSVQSKQGAWTMPPSSSAQKPRPSLQQVSDEGVPVPSTAVPQKPTYGQQQPTQQQPIGIEKEMQQTLKHISATLMAQLEENRSQGEQHRKQIVDDIAQRLTAVVERCYCNGIQDISERYASMRSDMEARDEHHANEMREMKMDIMKLRNSVLNHVLSDSTSDPAKVAAMQQGASTASGTQPTII